MSKAAKAKKAGGAGKAARAPKGAGTAKAAPKPRKGVPAAKAAAKRAAVAKKRAAPEKAGAAPRIAPDAGDTPPPRPPPPPLPPPPPPPPHSPPSHPPPRPSQPTPAPPGGGWPPHGWAPSASYAPSSGGLDALALTALVLGIASIPMFIFFVPAVLAIVLGLLGRRNIKVDPTKSGKGMATAGVVLGILSLVGAVAFVVALIASADDSEQSVGYSTLQPGDCYDNDVLDERDVELRSCSEEHRREAFAVLDHPGPPGREYPGRESVRRYAIRECTTRFPAYVGKAYEESRLRIVTVFPRRDAWEDEGLRRVVCAAARPDDEDLTRTVRDSGV